ncbi:putative PAS/PAC sensor protein [Desulfarculus baarsii DSM 2075]|uniref:histidine kinase n=1 Tax=Desulfarculus baarsii (strain ATCC 33931 / DSM 2075 / LMG 7858 / VKM B-1802 / 2st14) TaxID=644282 RepID=E1QJ81_DESB2|nr:PAS domain S-box protein [Desulfarculus baarsii]ADK85624.1 putative PAS/PAC sensor protein [Desulfarculus baarsii DSM 2075]
MALLDSGQLWRHGLDFVSRLAGSRGAPSQDGRADDLWFWREQVFFAVFLVFIVAGSISFVPTMIGVIEGELWLAAALYTLIYALAGVVTFAWRLPYRLRATLGLSLLYWVGALTVNVIGLHGSGRIWLFTFALLGAAFLGLRFGLLAVLINFATMKAFLYLAPDKAREWEALYHQGGHEAVWNIATATLTLLCLTAVMALAFLLKSLELSLERAKALRAELEDQGRQLSRANDELRREIEQRRQAQQSLEASERRHRLLLEASPDPIVMLDQDGFVSYANPAFEATFGPCPVEGGRARPPFTPPPIDATSAMATIGLLQKGRHGQMLEVELRQAPLPGPDGAALGRVLVLHDVSESRRAERERVAREKLQAAIETAGAACHELNQPLQAVLLQSELLLEDMEPGAAARPGVETVLAATKRMAEITFELNRLAEYHTKQYVGGSKILDLRRSTAASGREP